MDDETYGMLRRFIAVRRALKVKKPHENLLFVTSGGLPFRTFAHDLNTWNKAHGYPDNVTPNMIRRATQDAAAAQGMDIQTDVCRHLAHSLATADRNYRSKDREAALRAGQAVELVQDNYRILRRAQRGARNFLGEFEDFPTPEVLQEFCRRALKKDTFHLTQKTYEDIKKIWESDK